MSTLGWSDEKRRANIKLSNLRPREDQLERQKDRLKHEYCRALVLDDPATIKKLEAEYWPIQREWSQVVAARVAADKEFKECQ